ncbi:hypothetical protein AGMMS49975_06090 [Clostridia bacterium]|nr:hypothetical protein AGMMS49975_06090 [Clostridia bacterium]
MARTPLYRSEFHDPWAWSLAILGRTDVEIAEAMGISRKTLSAWKYTKMPDNTKVLTSFGEALANGKDAIDLQVEQALFKRAIGYTIVEKEQFKVNGETRTKLKDKHIPPDTKAAEAWLYNRQSDRWRPPQQVAVNIKSEDENGNTHSVVVLPFGSDCRINNDESEG